jgi:phage gp16-like protein
MTRALVKLVHVGCRDLGIDGETRRDLQLLVTGKASITEMTEADLESMVRALKDRGFKPSPGSAPRRKAAERGDVRFAHVLWGKLHRAGAVDKAGAAGLNAFIRARFEQAWGAVPIDIDAMRDWQQIAAVIQALKAMCARAGIDLGARP